jgi:hypothetical protein
MFDDETNPYYFKLNIFGMEFYSDESLGVIEIIIMHSPYIGGTSAPVYWAHQEYFTSEKMQRLKILYPKYYDENMIKKYHKR